MWIEELRQQKARLQTIADLARESLAGAPEGSLRVSGGPNAAARFYWKKPGEKAQGSYIPAGNEQLVARLAQKEYDKKVLRLAEQQLRAIGKLLSDAHWGFEQHSVAGIFSAMHPSKRQLVKPYVVPDDIFAAQWQQADYAGMDFDPDAPHFYTERGERVRSKSEMLISHALIRHGIPYHYELPLQLPVGRLFYPDFTVLNVRTREVFYWEHFGMMDDIEYVGRTMYKLSLYDKSGILPGKQLIVTRESRAYPLEPETIERAIRAYLL